MDDFKGVSLGGDLVYNEAGKGPVFDLKLKPLQIDKCFRLGERFGYHRFFFLGLPGTSTKDLPKYLKCNTEAFRNKFSEWMAGQTFHILGREWRCVYVKPKKAKPKSGRSEKKTFNSITNIAVLFAVNGVGFNESSPLVRNAVPSKMTVEELLEWLIDFGSCREHTIAKLFARIALGMFLLYFSLILLAADCSQALRAQILRLSSPTIRSF